MSEHSFRSPATTRSESVTFTDTSSLPHPHSRGRKIRLRILTRDPLPQLQFLAPFNYDDREPFHLLQRFVRNHIQAKRKENSAQWDEIKEENLVLMMDGFEVPFDDPDILRDGDVVEVQLNQLSASKSRQQTTDVKVESDTGESDSDEESEQDEESEAEEQSLTEAQDEEEKQAILEATRLAALFRAGIHTTTTAEDEAEPLSSASGSRRKQDDDLPIMPNLSSAAMPSMQAMPFPLMSSRSGGGGAAAALAAFEAKRNQFKAKVNPIAGPKRARSESCSSSSSESDSSSTDDHSTTSSSSSDGAPSEHSQNLPSQEPGLVPPGSGTSRTKRRNAMRREKLRLQREAALNQAKARSDRQPRHGMETFAATEKLPPGEDLSVVQEKKRKRQTTPSANPTPYGEEIPKGLSIKHVDCQKYYDAEVDKLEAMYSQTSTQGEKRARHHQDVDYGAPQPEGGSRKKPRLSPCSSRIFHQSPTL